LGVPSELRILCDRSADQRFVDTFERTGWITAIRVEDVLPADAPDRDISEFAEQHDWIVFTEDSDFLNHVNRRGLVRYHPLDNPSPGTSSTPSGRSGRPSTTTETSSNASPAIGYDSSGRSTNLAPRRAAVTRRG